MNKILAHNLVQSYGILSPKFSLLHKGSKYNQQIIDKFGKEFVIKPVDEGSSVGVEIILDGKFDINQYEWTHGDDVMIEKYIKGREMQVAIMDNKSLGVLEVKPKNLFYDYDAKYNPNSGTEYLLNPDICEDKKTQFNENGINCPQGNWL